MNAVVQQMTGGRPLTKKKIVRRDRSIMPRRNRVVALLVGATAWHAFTAGRADAEFVVAEAGLRIRDPASLRGLYSSAIGDVRAHLYIIALLCSPE